MGWVSGRVSSTCTCEHGRWKEVQKRVQDTTIHLPSQLGHAWVYPKYLGRERVEVWKGVHERAIFTFAERIAEFGTESFLHVVVAGEFDKGPLLCGKERDLRMEGGWEGKTYC